LNKSCGDASMVGGLRRLPNNPGPVDLSTLHILDVSDDRDADMQTIALVAQKGGVGKKGCADPHDSGHAGMLTLQYDGMPDYRSVG
jgi:hypothetical protein